METKQRAGAASGGNGNKGEMQPGCICNRKVMGLFCNACGYTLQSTTVVTPLKCSLHPRVRFTSALDLCPDCKQKDQLREIPDF